jgi:hypothetical protein
MFSGNGHRVGSDGPRVGWSCAFVHLYAQLKSLYHAVFHAQEQWAGGFSLEFEQLAMNSEFATPCGVRSPGQGVGAEGASPPWLDLVRDCNMLRADPASWWSRILADPEIVPRCDETGIVLRLRGNAFLELQREGQALIARIAHEYLIPAHPGSRVVLTERDARPAVARIDSLEELAERYDVVRRRVCRDSNRRDAVLDRLYARHACVVGVDVPLAFGRVDLVALAPDGTCVFMLLRRYADQDVRLAGPGGICARIRGLEAGLCSVSRPHEAVSALVQRMRAVDGPWARRFALLPEARRIYPRVRLAVVDFDHAQRQSGLADLRMMLERGLDRDQAREDILTIGDPGNISHGVIFSGIGPDGNFHAGRRAGNGSQSTRRVP